jgi:hypothetical protein
MDRRKHIQVVGAILFALGVTNFVVFAVVGLLLGGDAWNGKVVDGHYFLAQHGRLTEVSQAVWTYSYIHVLIVFALLPMMVAGGLMNVWARGLLTTRPASGKDKRRGE